MKFSLRKGDDNRPVSQDKYNNIEEIRTYYLDDLTDFWTLVTLRREAGIYGRDERLTPFVIHGKLVLLGDGNFGVRQQYDPKKTYPDIATFEELQEEVGMIGIDVPLPWPDDVSCVSQKPWTVANANDFILVCGDNKERICYTVSEYTTMLTESAKKDLLEAFKKAGFKVNENAFKETENKYGSFSYRGSWFEVTTIFGIFIIGWRKRVIECTIPSGLGVSCGSLITDEVTKSENHFHAYSYDKVAEYLTLVYNALKAK